MRRQLLRPGIILSAIIAAETAALIGVVAVQRWRAEGVSRVERGRQVAEHLGCFACHGPGGTQGIPNPGSDETEVPAWSGGTAMMYVQKEQDIREWILYGGPRGHENETGEHASAEPDHPSDQSDLSDASDRPHEHALIHMPAYEGRLTEQELGDLIAYYKAVAWFPMPTDEKARAGMEVAHEQGCFGCHGPAGRGTVSNPGSFKGYIPGWDGSDYREVVKGDAELRQWVLNGVSDRFAKNPAAKAFLDRAPLKMPAYKAVLTPKDLEALADYIRWLRREPTRGRS
jgi:mono/diheme cytochrome c family protein